MHSKYYMPRRIWSTGRSDYPYLFGKTLKCERGFPHAMDMNATGMLQAAGLQWMSYGKTEKYNYGNQWNKYENPMYDNKHPSKDLDYPKWGRQRLLKTKLRKRRIHGKSHEVFVSLHDREDIVEQTLTLAQMVYHSDYRSTFDFWKGFEDGAGLHIPIDQIRVKWGNPEGASYKDTTLKDNLVVPSNTYDEPFIHIGVGARALALIDEEDYFGKNGWVKYGVVNNRLDIHLSLIHI